MKRAPIGPSSYRQARITMACFYSAPLAWNPTGVDTIAGSFLNLARLVQSAMSQKHFRLFVAGVRLIPSNAGREGCATKRTTWYSGSMILFGR